MAQCCLQKTILPRVRTRSEEHTSELQSRPHLVCRLLLEKKNEVPLVVRAAAHVVRRLTCGRGPAAGRGEHLLGGGLFFFNDTATTEIYTLSLHDALPIYRSVKSTSRSRRWRGLGPEPMQVF